MSNVMPNGSTIVRKAQTKVTAEAEEKASHTLELDFSGCTIDDVLEDAARSAVIRWQRLYREHPDRYPEGKVTVSMQDVYARERVQMTPQERIESAFAKLSPEERQAMLARLTGE